MPGSSKLGQGETDHVLTLHGVANLHQVTVGQGFEARTRHLYVTWESGDSILGRRHVGSAVDVDVHEDVEARPAGVPKVPDRAAVVGGREKPRQPLLLPRERAAHLELRGLRVLGVVFDAHQGYVLGDDFEDVINQCRHFAGAFDVLLGTQFLGKTRLGGLVPLSLRGDCLVATNGFERGNVFHN